jgi:hypothetical protein
VLEAFLARRSPDGVVVTPEGWNDTEATRELEVSALTNWLLVWTLRLAATRRDVIVERLGAVDVRLTLPEQVQVRPREEQDDGRRHVMASVM